MSKRKGTKTYKATPRKDDKPKAKRVVEPKPEPRLVMENEAYEKFTDYVRLCNVEVGVFGYVQFYMDGIHPTFYVDDVLLMPQEVSGGHVDYEPEAFEKAIQKSIDDDRINDLRFSAHSHVNMGAFWSATDEEFIRGMNTGAPWHVSLVMNKSGSYEARVDFYKAEGIVGQVIRQVTQDLKLLVKNLPENNDEIRKKELDENLTQAHVTTKPAKDWRTKHKTGQWEGEGKDKKWVTPRQLEERAAEQRKKDKAKRDANKNKGKEQLTLADLTKDGFIPDYMNFPSDIEKWGWHDDFGWVRLEGKDIIAIWSNDQEFKVVIPNRAHEVDMFDYKDEEEDESDELVSSELVKAVMERGQI